MHGQQNIKQYKYMIVISFGVLAKIILKILLL